MAQQIPSKNLHWIGEEIVMDLQKPIFRHRSFYSGFKLNEWSMKLGQFALVNKTEYKELEQQNFAVVRVLMLYQEQYQKEYKAYVEWYTWPFSALQKCSGDNIIFDFDNEVIQDMEIQPRSICLTKFIGPCVVMFGDVKDVASDIIEKIVDYGVDGPVYVCRYRLMQIGELIHLEPVLHLPDIIPQTDL